LSLAKISKEKVPVFVFLDENVSCANFEKLKSARISPRYELKVIPFPPVMDCLGIFDFQVALFLKKMILSSFYGIYRVLHNNPLPIFIFLTKDLTFIEDAEKGFESWRDNRKRRNQDRNIKFYKDPVNPDRDIIAVKRPEGQFINIAVKYIKGAKKETKHSLIYKMIRLLENYLQE